MGRKTKTHLRRVFRVEHLNTGIGPYRGAKIEQMSRAHNNSMRHPTPLVDCGLCGLRHDEVCGFVSPWALVEWFKGWFGLLHSRGFRLAVYENVRVVAKSRKGTGQVVFCRKKGLKPKYSKLPLGKFRA